MNAAPFQRAGCAGSHSRRYFSDVNNSVVDQWYIVTALLQNDG